MRLQSAMEYLMTYGWAILIIAVVLIGLNYLGIFNSETFAPKASPGACYVLRTAAEVSLAGECNGYIPRSVGYFSGPGTSSFVSTGTTNLPLGSAARSVFAWIYYTGGSAQAVVYSYGTISADEQAALTVQSGVVKFAGNVNVYQSTLTVPNDTWCFIGYNYTAGSDTVTVYLNKQSQTGTLSSSEALDTILTGTFSSAIGSSTQSSGNLFQGYISNIQVYNSSLSASTVQSMYADGIGGAPIQLQNLVAWWPLNGDTNDYSGQGNNGANNNVAFNQNWYTTYTPT